MFKNLLSILFPSIVKKDSKPNYYAFTEASQEENKRTEDVVNIIQTNKEEVVAPKLIDENFLNETFNQYLFGKHERIAQNDELCEFVIERIELALAKPKQLVDCLPILPLSITTLLTELKSENFDTAILIEVIEKEPSIAAKVIELANSAYYRRGEKDVTDLKSAFMCMGSKGLMEGVINGFVSQFTPKASVYYKQFGEKIWQHSLDNGNITKVLLNESGMKEESATGYFVGLVLHLGHMIIFQLMMEAFAYVDPDAKPDAVFFNKVLNKYSVTLTYKLAKHWKLPQSLLENIAIQLKIKSIELLSHAQKNYPIAVAVYEGNYISMIETLFNKSLLTEKEVKTLRQKLMTTESSHAYLEEMLEKMAS